MFLNAVEHEAPGSLKVVLHNLGLLYALWIIDKNMHTFYEGMLCYSTYTLCRFNYYEILKIND